MSMIYNFLVQIILTIPNYQQEIYQILNLHRQLNNLPPLYVINGNINTLTPIILFHYKGIKDPSKLIFTLRKYIESNLTAKDLLSFLDFVQIDVNSTKKNLIVEVKLYSVEIAITKYLNRLRKSWQLPPLTLIVKPIKLPPKTILTIPISSYPNSSLSINQKVLYLLKKNHYHIRKLMGTRVNPLDRIFIKIKPQREIIFYAGTYNTLKGKTIYEYVSSYYPNPSEYISEENLDPLHYRIRFYTYNYNRIWLTPTLLLGFLNVPPYFPHTYFYMEIGESCIKPTKKGQEKCSDEGTIKTIKISTGSSISCQYLYTHVYLQSMKVAIEKLVPSKLRDDRITKYLQALKLLTSCSQ